jgi:hypothetical protein
MAVTINKTDGTVLTTIQDGAIDTSNTNLTLIGRLYRNYGELVNENFVKLLENFANSSSPTTPIIGQIWFNTSTGLLNVYRSTGFVGLATLTTSAAQPNLPRQGDLWFDTADGQLKLYSGTAWIIVSPQFSLSQTKSGIFIETIRDVLNANHICLMHYQQNAVVAVHCRDAEWIPQAAISGFSSIKPGFNLSSTNSQKFVGDATNALALGNIEASRYLRNDTNGEIDGSLKLSNNGLTIGELDDLQFYITGDEAYFVKPDGRLTFTVNSNDALRITSESQVQVGDGSALFPSISFISDTNSGIYHVDENIIGVTIAGDTILEISLDGLYVNGNIQANNYTGTLNADEIFTSNLTVTNNTVTRSLQVNDNAVLGSSASDIVQFRASNISIPNGLVFSSANVTFNGLVKLGSSLTSDDGVTAVTINPDLYVTGDAEIEGILTANNGLNVGGILIGDSSGRLRLNSSVATGYANIGDFSMGSTNGIRSYNSPKMWIAFNGTLAGLAIYDSFNIDFVTRTSTNNYTFTTEYPISSGAMAVIGTNGTLLTTAPSIGATSFSITTTSENTRMALVVLSQ